MQTESLGHDDIKFYPPPIHHRSMEHHYTDEVSHIEECTPNLWIMMTLSFNPPPIHHRSMEHHYTDEDSHIE